jgi:hypothetical protein
MCQQGEHGVGLDRGGEEESLSEGGLHRFEPGGLLGTFDALGDDVELEAVPEVDDALHEVRILAVSLESIDE